MFDDRNFDKNAFLKGFTKIPFHLSVNMIDEFRSFVDGAIDNKVKQLEEALNEEYKDLKYTMHLQESMSDTIFLNFLCDELSILSLFKELEINFKKMVELFMPSKYKELSSSKNKKSSQKDIHLTGDTLCNVLGINKTGKSCYDILTKEINNFNAFNKLRLINNSIKHNGKACKDLVKYYPVNIYANEVTAIGEKYVFLVGEYDNLKPKVIEFYNELAEIIYNKREINL